MAAGDDRAARTKGDDSQAGDGNDAYSRQKTDIPSADAHKGPEDFRRRVTKGLSEPASGRLKADERRRAPPTANPPGDERRDQGTGDGARSSVQLRGPRAAGPNLGRAADAIEMGLRGAHRELGQRADA